MSLQEPQEQFERETEDTIDELKDASTESPLSDSDVHVPSNESDSVSASANDRSGRKLYGSLINCFVQVVQAVQNVQVVIRQMV